MEKETPDRNFALELVRVTEAAALAAARWQGRGDKEAGDQAAVDAMRLMLSTIEMDGVVVIGEGEKDEAPMLYNGESIGTGHAPQVDVAVDPIDGTTLLSEGRSGSLSVIALAPRGTMLDPGPCVYMEKLVVGPDAAGAVDLDASVAENIEAVAKAKGKEPRDVTVIMLDRERHEDFKRQIREVGARLRLITDGDVSAAVLAAWPERTDIDMLLGIGGTPEGVTAACAVKALGGEILGRLWPRNDDERAETQKMGYDLSRVLTTDDLVDTDDCFFVCTGVTDGQLLEGVSFESGGASTHSLVMRSKSGTLRMIKARHRLEKLRNYASIEY
jgi:fructose-1,6-bisphosphatase II